MIRSILIRSPRQPLKEFSPALLLSLAFLLSTQTVAFAVTSYDPYAPIASEEEDAHLKITKRREVIRPIADIFAVPFEVAKYAFDPILYEVETRHIPKKIDWIFDELKEEGVNPNVIKGGLGAGVEIEAVKLAQLEGQFPGVSWNNEINWSFTRDEFKISSGPEFQRIMDSPVSVRAGILYDRLSEEDFWGVGPDSGLGQGSNYLEEKTAFNLGAEYDFNYLVLALFDFGYEHVNIAEGNDSNETHGGGKNNIKAAFPTLPGINGSDEVNFTSTLEHNRLNNENRPTRGHREKISFGYHHGVRGSDTRYFNYVADLAFFIPVFSERRVFAFRFYGEHNSELDSAEIPFFNKARLGGHEGDLERGLPLRSFERNRFFDDSVAVMNIEYRYNIWHYRDYKIDAVVFFDEGMVFDKFSEMQWNDLQESYGGGFRVFALNKNILTVEVAHGNEGTEFYARSGTIF